MDSPIYQEMDSLYRLTGHPLPSASRPWNTNEALQMLTQIPEDGRHEALRQSIEGRIGPTDRTNDSFSWRVTQTLNLEGYLHTNPTDFKTYHDWNRGYDEGKPFESPPIGALFEGGDVILPISAYNYKKSVNSNLFQGMHNLETDFPQHSQLTAAGPWWAITLGRGPRSWEHGQKGDLQVSIGVSKRF